MKYQENVTTELITGRLTVEELCLCGTGTYLFHGLEYSFAESKFMYVEHFGIEPSDKMPFAEMVDKVIDKHGYHHVQADLNAIRGSQWGLLAHIPSWHLPEEPEEPTNFCTKDTLDSQSDRKQYNDLLRFGVLSLK